jgi:aspartyl-tRNA(Asn)/glutamyl-tRNA(Gln) amidotransferase subunit C
VEYIAHLARLAIEEQDIPAYTNSLSNILELIAQMKEVDTDGIEPMAHPLELPQRQRPDTVTETDHHEELQQNAPQVESSFFLVPKVIE